MAAPRARFIVQGYYPWGQVGVLAIVDNGRAGVSVAEDAAAVVDYLHFCGLLKTHDLLVYRDGERTWDQLVHDHGKLSGFRYLGAPSLEVALEKLGMTK